jgi:hypothetical protein
MLFFVPVKLFHRHERGPGPPTAGASQSLPIPWFQLCIVQITPMVCAQATLFRAPPMEELRTFTALRSKANLKCHSVHILREGEGWTVVILEDGDEVRNTFAIQEHATNYAEGQRLRLNLPALDIELPPPRPLF